MKSYIQGEITITAAQRAELQARIVGMLHGAIWKEGWNDLWELFVDNFYEALQEIADIEVMLGSVSFACSRLIEVESGTRPGLEDLQERIWQKKLRKGCSEIELAALVDETLNMSFDFLGVRVVAAKASAKPPRLRRVA
jgi:hypothetical protein